jgi:integrase
MDKGFGRQTFGFGKKRFHGGEETPMTETNETKRKGKQAEFTYIGGKYPGVCFLTGKAGKTFYAKYTAPGGKRHFEKIGTEAERWTPAKVRDERADRKRGKAKTNEERRDDAKAAAEAKAKAIAENAVTDETTFEKYATAWLERKKATLALSTFRDYRSAFKVYASPHLGKIPLTKITYKTVEDFVAKIEGISGKRTNNVLVPLKCLFNDAKRRGDITENPTEKIRRAKETVPEIDPLSLPEMNLFLANVDPHYVAYFTTAFLTGMRPSEMIALKWHHVDFEMRCITVREGRVQGIEGPPKTRGSNRDVDVLPPLYEVLRKHRMESPADARYVFTARKGGPLEVNNLRNDIWYPTLEKAKLRDRPMYQAKHTFASLMLSHGEDPAWVSKMLGHSTLAMVYKHYAKYIRNRNRTDGSKFLVEFDAAGVSDKALAAVDATVEVEAGVVATNEAAS